MGNNWTPKQENAIDARGMQVLVSAAAGSGKTAVLTERVKRIVTDPESSCSVSQLLVVTFTRAAAGEMKDRIQRALLESDSISKDRIREQLASLPLADICTIDSFCSKIVRDNFKKANISADFTILDNVEEAEMNDAAVEEVIKRLYEKGDKQFLDLTSMLIGDKDDSSLDRVILDLYKYSRSEQSPSIWLNKVVDDFSQNEPNDTIWADSIYKHIILFADFYINRFNKCIPIIVSEGFTEDYYSKFDGTRENICLLKDAAENKNWDGMVDLIRAGISFSPKPRVLAGDVSEDVKNLMNGVYKDFTDDLENVVAMNLPKAEEHKSDCAILQPLIKVLCDAVETLEEILEEEKKKRNAYSFNDILHKCIDILVEFTGDGDDDWVPTDVAMSLREKYKEIFIDEYQDTNEAQNIIFKAISQDKSNLYFVGDVKQSIYKFRLASPHLFTSLKKSMVEYTKGVKQPSLIRLDKNFRSREGVLKVANHVSAALMSEDVGEINYNGEEELVFGAEWYSPKNEPCAELLLFNCPDKNSTEAKLVEAEKIAEYINVLVNVEKPLVFDPEEKIERPIKPADICILLGVMKNKAPFYANALEQLGISANTVSNENTALSKEIQFLISLIKAISNPLDDVALVSVMFSPVFGFTADELSQIRIFDRENNKHISNYKGKEFYLCVSDYAQQSEKASNFLKKLQLYRNISASYPIDEFVRFIVRDTDILNIYLAGDNGASRNANIRGFIQLAESFTSNGRVGLNAFIKSVDSAVKNEKLTTYAGVAALDGVKIMSIHKSKGLEFPYVIIADCSGEFNKRNAYNTVKLSRATRLGIKIRDDENYSKFNSLSSAATEKDILYSTMSEFLRVLYVAMTRAREHLVFSCSIFSGTSTKKKTVMNDAFDFDDKGRLHPFAVYDARSFSDWIVSVLSQNELCKEVRDTFGISSHDTKMVDYPINVRCYDLSEKNENEEHTNITIVDEATSDSSAESSTGSEELEYQRNRIFDRLADINAFEYGYDCSGILAKRTASSAERHYDDDRYFASRRPDFIKKKMTGADKGTAVHKFFELCDINNASVDFGSEISSLVCDAKMTQREADVLTKADVDAFFNNDIGKRLLASDEILREYEFSFIKKAGELYSDLPQGVADEEIVIQGKLDCAFKENDGYVLIDYKSDNMNSEDEYKTIYKPQLDIYAQALEACTEVNVKEKYIYSFKLQKFIDIDK